MGELYDERFFVVLITISRIVNENFGRQLDEYGANILVTSKSNNLSITYGEMMISSVLTMLENVMLPLIVTDYTKEQKLARAKEILERVGLSSKMKRFPDELSGGEQQRVAIARALVNEPLLILADEPTGNLDSITGIEMMKLFKELNDSGKTIIVVTHNPENAKFADRCVYVKDGKLLGVEVLP